MISLSDRRLTKLSNARAVAEDMFIITARVPLAAQSILTLTWCGVIGRLGIVLLSIGRFTIACELILRGLLRTLLFCDFTFSTEWAHRCLFRQTSKVWALVSKHCIVYKRVSWCKVGFKSLFLETFGRLLCESL